MSYRLIEPNLQSQGGGDHSLLDKKGAIGGAFQREVLTLPGFSR